MDKKCDQCGEPLHIQFELIVHSEKQEVSHIGHICSGCKREFPSDLGARQKSSPWKGVIKQLQRAQEVGSKIGKDGDYYKKGHFGFSFYDGQVQSILLMEGYEPEVEPIVAGFGLLQAEVVIDENNGEAQDGV